MKRFWMKKLPSALLALVLVIGLMPAAAAASVAKTYEVDEDDYVWLDAEDFWKIYDDTYDGDEFEYITFTDYDDFDDYGYFTFDDFNGDEYDDVDSSELDEYRFYYDYDSTDATRDDIDLDTLKFVTYDGIDSDTLDFEIRLNGNDGRTTATIRIDVEGGGSKSKGGTISYTVKANSSVAFDADDFNSLFKKAYSSTLRYVVFDSPSASAYSGGSIYYRYGRSSSTEFSRSELRSTEFYYDDSSYGDYDLDELSFVASKNFSGTIELTFTAYGSGSRSVDGTLKISSSKGSSSSSSKGDITIDVDVNDEVTLDAEEFWDLFDDETDHDEELYSLEFTSYDDFDDYGYFYAAGYDDDEDYDDEYELNDSDLDEAVFYYKSRNATDAYEFELDTLTFVTYKNADEDSLEFEFTMTGDDDEEIDGTLVINIGKGSGSSSGKQGDIYFENVKSNEEVEMDVDDFNDYFQDEGNTSNDFTYLRFTDSENLTASYGYFYYRYGRSSQERFTATSVEDAYFYFDADDAEDDDEYPLEDLSFVAASNFTGTVTMDFELVRGSKKVPGTMTISAGSGSAASNIASGSVNYYLAKGTALQINANDIARFFTRQYPGATLQSVQFLNAPSAGGLYYNYYGSRTQVTSGNAGGMTFYRSPSASQYDLNKLTYIPSGSNYCTTLLFTARGTGGQSVLGSMVISVTHTAISEVYGVTPKGTTVSFPAGEIYNAVYRATGKYLSSIQLLELPAASKGAVSLGSGYVSLKANTSTKYTYAGGTQSMSQLKFVPAAAFTGSVEIPYMAYDASGSAIGAGKFSLGIVASKKSFSDVSSSTWCYKYVTELASSNIIGGYSNGTFRPDNTITYGAALKLIMLAAGYAEQAPTGSNTFSGYLSRSQADGLVSGNVNLSGSISRLQVAQLAAKAMKLSTSNLSSVKPFTDTSDVYVQALNAAGIVEGYFSNGTSTFKPGNTLTRGQVSAIVWSMRNYNK